MYKPALLLALALTGKRESRTHKNQDYKNQLHFVSCREDCVGKKFSYATENSRSTTNFSFLVLYMVSYILIKYVIFELFMSFSTCMQGIEIGQINWNIC